MTPKTSAHIIKGMQKDTSESKLSKEFAFDAKNIRITAREDNSLLSITNEKGNEIVTDLGGNYLGHCVLNNQVVFFFKRGNIDYISLNSNYDEETNIFNIRETLYVGNLNFNLNNPIEALGVYENEDIQKVYWVDGLNQPRVINIKASEEVKSKWTNTSFDFIPELALQESVSIEAISNSSLFAPGVIQYAFSYYNKYGQESNIFDVTPLCYIAHKERGASPEEVIKDIAFKIKVNNVDTNFNYIRIYSIHRTSLNAVPTVKRIIDLPISIPEEFSTVSETHSAYSIGSINKAYIRRLDELLPGVIDYNGKLLTEVFNSPPEISSETSEFGTITTYKLNRGLSYNWDIVIGEYNGEEFIIEKEISGDISYFNYVETVINREGRAFYDYSFNSYTNTSVINPKFITVKYKVENGAPSITHIDNGTLGETIDPTQLLYIGGEDIIAGTITQKDNTLFLGNIELKKLSIDNSIKESIKRGAIFPHRRTEELNTEKEIFYSHELDTINKYSYYKAGEHYRLGIQFQHKSGRWSEPIFIADFTQGMQMRPSLTEDDLYLPSLYYTIPTNLKDSLYSLGFKKMRGLVVFPEAHERKVIAQGMLCPTVFNPEDRKNNNPYSQSSWFLRPYLLDNINDNYFENTNNGSGLTYEDNLKEINKGAVIEFRHRKPLITGANRGSEIQNNTEYLIDQSILNFYSPDINDAFISNNLDKNIQMRIVGLINFTSNYGDIDIQTKTPPRSTNAKGFIHKTISNLTSGKSGLISGLYYNDDDLLYMIHPWHRSGSLNDDNASSANSNNKSQSAVLEKKKISNIKFSKYNTWISYDKIWNSFGGNSKTSLANGISKIEYFNSDQVSLLKLNSNIEEESLNYFGNIDTLLSNENNYPIYYGYAWADENLLESEVEGVEPVRIKYKTTPHLVFKLNNATSGHEVVLPTVNNLNSVNGNQIEITEEFNPEYIGEEIKYRTSKDTPSTDFPSNAEEGDLWLKEEEVWYNYYPNTPPNPSEVSNHFTILRLLKYDGKEWKDHTQGRNKDKKNKVHYLESPYEASLYYFNGRVAVGQTTDNNNYDYAFTWKFEKKINITPPSIENITVTQDSIEVTAEYPYLYLAELYVDSEYLQNTFGGNTEEAIKNNLWLPASQSIPIDSDSIIYEYGDTRYQRYDCLKTYAFTPEDENQVIEIASFMCETRVNMLGRYDKNIGNLSNLNADPTNFNLFNPVYSQKDNFFNYRILDSDIYKLNNFPNTITWSKEKHLGEDIDTWTHVTMANTLDLDGTKGKVNKLVTFNEQIFAFQDKGVSNVLFNNRVQIPVSDGVPIEITNGYKVEGSRYISTELGCRNKYSIQVTPSGIYFLDSESGGIYLLGGEGLTNLSTNKGFDIWTKEVAYDSTFKTFYDKNNKDVYFVTKDYCLGYSEKLEQFTSFYDYNGVDTMFNVDSNFFSIKTVYSIYQYPCIWAQFKGEYNKIFNQIRPYSITYIENDEPLIDKVFTNIEYRADAFDSNNNYLADLSFDTITAWNEYQEGKETLVFSKYRPSNLKKKFRMWRANIPRDKTKKLDRMRNPWLFIKLSKENPSNERMELHDMLVYYFQ